MRFVTKLVEHLMTKNHKDIQSSGDLFMEVVFADNVIVSCCTVHLREVG